MESATMIMYVLLQDSLRKSGKVVKYLPKG